jgi:hypothetical protein
VTSRPMAMRPLSQVPNTAVGVANISPPWTVT